MVPCSSSYRIDQTVLEGIAVRAFFILFVSGLVIQIQLAEHGFGIFFDPIQIVYKGCAIEMSYTLRKLIPWTNVQLRPGSL